MSLNTLDANVQEKYIFREKKILKNTLATLGVSILLMSEALVYDSTVAHGRTYVGGGIALMTLANVCAYRSLRVVDRERNREMIEQEHR